MRPRNGLFIITTVGAAALALAFWAGSGTPRGEAAREVSAIPSPVSTTPPTPAPEIVQTPQHSVVLAASAARMDIIDDIIEIIDEIIGDGSQWPLPPEPPPPEEEYEYTNTWDFLNLMLNLIAQIQNPHVSPNLTPANAGMPGAPATFSTWADGVEDIEIWLAQAKAEAQRPSPSHAYIGYRLDSAKNAIELLMAMMEE